jgi:hypothetical protein
MKRCLAVLLVATAALAAGANRVSAHHSFAATYLEDQSVTIEGELVQFLFRNPHSFVHVNVKQKDGTVVRYAVEWGGAGQLSQQGMGPGALKAGDHVQITGSPGRNAGEHRIRMVSLVRPKTASSPELSWGRRPGEVVD